jgi:hypothetical protein
MKRCVNCGIKTLFIVDEYGLPRCKDCYKEFVLKIRKQWTKEEIEEFLKQDISIED